MCLMPYRVCKMFEVESGHMLSKHPGRCRYPHGHSRRVEVVLRSQALDENDMVCDFKAIKLALHEFIDRWDHSMAINSDDPMLETLRATGERLVLFDGTDPTTEVMARSVFDHLADLIERRVTLHDAETGAEYTFPAGLKVERVRVTETSSSWAEYGVE